MKFISFVKFANNIVKGKITFAGIYVPCPPPAKNIVTSRHKKVIVNIFAIFI
ncbi:hypothetical protein SAMN05443549_104145 [Flavobacterium fluvii]|uniref:Uncharacterized protein n=1 Tax=Flavobacterium fluvii TaxID=468056 RepID=A0A1M5K0Y3_9FLAO|nr:hypothetical protein SAMN05443549_104145 [Flavobacterium fluvii]